MRLGKTLAILLILTVLSLLAAAIHRMEASTGNRDADFYGGFVQLCFSSRPSKLSFDRHFWWFAVGVSSRVLLVFGSFAGIVVIAESMISQRKLPMKYADVMALRDNTIRDILLTEMPLGEEEKEQFSLLFDKALQAANEDLTVQLRLLFGKDADLVLKRKHDTEQSPL